MTRRRLAPQTFLALLCCLPIALFAYMGQFTRMFHDDFLVAAIGLELGGIGSVVYYYNGWTGAYSSIFFKTELAPHSVLLPSLATLFIIVVWLVSLFWLFRQVFAVLRLEGRIGLVALAASALTVAAAINAFYSPQSFYWFAANMQYTVPLVAMSGCLALALWTIRLADSRASLLIGAGACALISFLTVGASEMFLVFQVVFFTLLAPMAFEIVDKPRRRTLAIVAGAMLLATAFGLVVQLASPGIAIRMQSDAQTYRPPIRSLQQLAIFTIQITFESVGRQEVFAGFALLMAVGMFIALRTARLSKAPSLSYSAERLSLAVLVGLGVQLVFLPILWAHQSDSPQILGRYSPSYMFVICLHIVLLLAFLVSAWQRRRLKRALERGRPGLAIASALLLTAFVLLFALTQIRSIDSRASTYLTISSLVFLAVLALLWQGGNTNRPAQKLGLLAIGSTVISWVTIAALVCVTFVGHGFSDNRIFAGPAFLQVAAGLFWGFYIGYSIRSCAFSVANQGAWESRLAIGSLALALVVAGGIFLGQAKFVPDLQTYAAEWDARHAYIISQRDRGQTQIEVEPLSFDLADYLGMATLRFANQFYGVESIATIDG